MNKMNPKIKKMWVDALRSGKYVQTHSQLRSKPFAGECEYCALGVLCDLAVMEGVVSWPQLAGRNMVPTEIQEWAGLQQGDPEVVSEEGIPYTVIEMNDDFNRTFPYIADCIEECL